jgi:2-iminobutanoate/2-iminopropanoate deaminase
MNPDSLPPAKGYAQVVVSEGSKIVWISGQVSLDRNGELVGRDSFRVQTEQAFRNIQEALAAAGATFGDVVKLDYYVTDCSPANIAIIRDVRQSFLANASQPSSTLVGVQALFRDDLSIEIQAIAVVTENARNQPNDRVNVPPNPCRRQSI